MNLKERQLEMLERQSVSDTLQSLESAIGTAPPFRQLWTIEQFKKARTPLVYIFWSDRSMARALYVGQSSGGISRPTSANHHRAEICSSASTVEFIGCASAAEAFALEMKLIRLLKPDFNGVKMARQKSSKHKAKIAKIVKDLSLDPLKDSFYSK